MQIDIKKKVDKDIDEYIYVCIDSYLDPLGVGVLLGPGDVLLAVDRVQVVGQILDQGYTWQGKIRTEQPHL